MIEKEYLKKAIADVKSAGSSKNGGMANYLVKLMSRPKRARVGVNIAKLEKFAGAGENVIVPGKVLGRGSMTKKINVAAVVYSGDAESKLRKAGCTIVDMKDMVKKENVRIII